MTSVTYENAAKALLAQIDDNNSKIANYKAQIDAVETTINKLKDYNLHLTDAMSALNTVHRLMKEDRPACIGCFQPEVGF